MSAKLPVLAVSAGPQSTVAIPDPLASAGFAALHPFLWRWDDAGFALTLGAKGGFSTAVVFALSLWLYVARLAPWNPQRSLLPCFAAHAAKNLGVVGVKLAAGFMGPLG